VFAAQAWPYIDKAVEQARAVLLCHLRCAAC
jgi:hypothetical protein